VELIREAKAKGLPVSCDVAAHQLAYFDSDLMDFDTNLKVNPPFRQANDHAAIRAGLGDGTIDAIVSDHSPHDEECKNLEFDHADFGITGLETAFSLAVMHAHLPIGEIIEKLTTQPRHILRLPALSIEEGQEANLTFFEADSEWVFEKTYSKSKNTPFLGKTLKGKVVGVINNNRLEWFD
jgi:dihydroorotase